MHFLSRAVDEAVRYIERNNSAERGDRLVLEQYAYWGFLHTLKQNNLTNDSLQITDLKKKSIILYINITRENSRPTIEA